MALLMETSGFWKEIGERNEKQIKQQGFSNFKRTINNKYFNWRIFNINHPLFQSMLKKFISHPTPDILNIRIIEKGRLNADERHMGWLSRKIYTFYIASLYIYVKRMDKYGLINTLEEPTLGNPIRVTYKNRLISQDLCHSINEFNQIMNNTQLPNKPNIVEIGAGYGRTAYIFLKETDCDYTIVDIHPAIDISRRYLTTLFPDRNISFLSPEEFENDNRKFDLVINISSFHEMTQDTINCYFDLIHKKMYGYFYFKEWIHWKNPVDNIIVGLSNYPIYLDWVKVFKRRCHIQPKFFEAMFKSDESTPRSHRAPRFEKRGMTLLVGAHD